MSDSRLARIVFVGVVVIVAAACGVAVAVFMAGLYG